MRLIDADKIEYMWKQDINGNFHDGVTLESIVDKTPTVNVNDLIVEELEKVKAELEKTYPMNGYGILSSRATGKSAGYGIHIALEIIDKHISKLEGE